MIKNVDAGWQLCSKTLAGKELIILGILILISDTEFSTLLSIFFFFFDDLFIFFYYTFRVKKKKK